MELLAHAFARGITFFDDARYDDRTGTAPIPTGWSEVVFGERFRGAGIPRHEVVVANKLWWEFWPEQSAVAEVDASLERMRFEHVDLVYAAPLPDGLSVETALTEIADVLGTRHARAWGVLNWSADAIQEATRSAAARGLAPPCAAQLPYNLMYRTVVEDPAMDAALARSGASIVPAAVLAGGALTGKYGVPTDGGRLAGRLERPTVRAAVEVGERLSVLAKRLDATPAALAIAFTLEHPRTASTLLGATTPAQIDANVDALSVLDRLSAAELAAIREIGAG